MAGDEEHLQVVLATELLLPEILAEQSILLLVLQYIRHREDNAFSKTLPTPAPKKNSCSKIRRKEDFQERISLTLRARKASCSGFLDQYIWPPQ